MSAETAVANAAAMEPGAEPAMRADGVKGYRMLPVLRIDEGSHRATTLSKDLLRQVGGRDRLLGMTRRFYTKVFANPKLEPFFELTEVDYHASRLANWVAEKMGDLDRPWTEERMLREFPDGGQEVLVANAFGVGLRSSRCPVSDRSSAHVAAWQCKKRIECPATKTGHVLGAHFKLDDTRVWMRLHFWACRETGLFPGGGAAAAEEPAAALPAEVQLQFQNWYERFLGHFVKVYEREAPTFARLESAWSDQRTERGSLNVAAYTQAQAEHAETYFAEGWHFMPDVVGLLDAREARRAAGIQRNDGWPYHDDGEFYAEAEEQNGLVLGPAEGQLATEVH